MAEQVDQLDQAIEALLAGAASAAGGDRELAALTEVASVLCDLPSGDFRNRLKTELQRRTVVTTSTTPMAGVGAGFRTITPFLIHSQAPELVEFLKTTFRAKELKRNAAGEPEGFYSEVRIGDTVIMIGGGTAARRGQSALHAPHSYRTPLGITGTSRLG